MKSRKIFMLITCILGVLAIIGGLSDITRGETRRILKGRHSIVYKRDERPVKFWIHAGGLVVVGGVFVFKGLSGFLSKDE